MPRASKVRSSGHGSSEVVDGASGYSEGYELQSIFPPYFSGHGSLSGMLIGTNLVYKRDPYVHS